MGFKRFVEDMHEMQRNLSELLAENTAEEEAASLEIAQSASRFSRRTRKVVEDKLSFSATLMRAGEVTAATRLLAEVEEEVRDEEIALIETVNEVKVAQAVRRGRITRLRLARSLAVAMLGACVLAFSAVGMAVAGVFKESERNVAIAPLKVDGRRGSQAAAGSAASPAVQRMMRRLQIGDVKLVLTKSEYQRLAALTDGDVNEGDLTDVLGLLSGTLRDKVSEAMAIASEVVETASSVAATDQTPVLRKVTRTKRKAAKAQEETASAEQQPSDDEESADPSSQEEDPEPSPSPSEGDTNEGGSEEGGASILGDDDDGLGGI